MPNRTRTATALAAALTLAIASGCQVLSDAGDVAEDTGESIASTETWQSIEGNWNDFKSAASDKWQELTADDIDDIGGNRESLIEEVSEAYDMTLEEAEAEVDEWADSLS